jgi:hypothetical protein
MSVSDAFYRYFSTCISFLLPLILTNCTGDAPGGLRSTPNAFGKVNDLVVVTDKEIWESPIGDSILYYYSGPFPILPQPEPILEIKYFSPEDLEEDQLRKQMRTYLFACDLSDNNSQAAKMMKFLAGEQNMTQIKLNPKNNIVVGKDKWAKGQMLIFQFARNRQELVENLKDNFPAILKKVRENDYRQMDATVFFEGRSEKIEQNVRNKIGVDIRIPKGYVQALSDEEIMWLRRETEETSSNIILSKIPYQRKEQLSREGIKAIQEAIGKKYVSTQLDNTYMKINDVDLPMYVNPIRFKNLYALEARGIWEIVNDYMGGAFVSYLILNPKTNDLIFIMGFLHAPGEDKRNFIQQIDHVIHTTRIP